MAEQTWRADNSLKEVAAGGRHIRKRMEGRHYRAGKELGRQKTHIKEWLLEAGISEKGWKAGITEQG
jgi:hypothetical protein